jgi:predicted HTH transcriptional regulator
MMDHNRHLEADNGDAQALQRMIREGEHQQQDFKFRIDSTAKIAKTLSAFANTDGGKLLIGVKDNGKITGVDPEEEFFMIEGAAQLYCQPAVPFEYQVYAWEDKRVLEIEIPDSAAKPHLAKEEDGRYRAYVRQADENFRANAVLLRFLRDKTPASKAKNLVAYGPAERLLFDYLSENASISISKFARLAHLPRREAEQIMASFLKWEVLIWNATEEGIRFALRPEAL